MTAFSVRNGILDKRYSCGRGVQINVLHQFTKFNYYKL